MDIPELHIGEVIENAIWLNGDESPEMRKRYESDVIALMEELCFYAGVTMGPVTFTEKHPDDDRVPPPPDHIQGQRVRLLVAEAEIIGIRVAEKPASFIANLELKDLEHLRRITLAAYTKHYPQAAPLSMEDVDDIIEALGPEAALDTLRNNALH